MSINERPHLPLPYPLDQPTLTIEETAAILQLGRNTVYAAVRSGEVPSIRVGRRYLVPTARLASMLGVGNDIGEEASSAATAQPPQSQRKRRALPA